MTPEDTTGLETLEAIFSNPNPFYLNLHTSVNPGGALRDQLQRTDTVVRRADMWPANEVPPVTVLSCQGQIAMAFSGWYRGSLWMLR